MSDLPSCPNCGSEYTYQDQTLFICPECAHEWPVSGDSEVSEINVIKDVNGNLLSDGDTVTVIKDLKVKGSSSVVKVGTKVKNIRLVDGDHDIDCKIDGFGAMKLKSEFVKKAQLIHQVNGIWPVFDRAQILGFFICVSRRLNSSYRPNLRISGLYDR